MLDDNIPDHVLVFLQSLRPEEVDHLQDAIRFFESAQTMGKFLRWVVMLAVSAFLGGAALMKAWHELWPRRY